MFSTVPTAVRKGQFVFTSTLDGADAAGAFKRLRRELEAQGATTADVVGVSAHVADWAMRDAVVSAARREFGGEFGLRVTPMPLPSGAMVEVQGVACCGAAAGRMVMTPLVGAQTIGAALDEVGASVKAAGGSPDDIVHVWAFGQDGIIADDFTPPWLERFPNEGNRPARKTWMRLTEGFGPERVFFQATALIGAGARSNYEVFGVRHREPLPLGARVGPLFMSSGIPGHSPHESDPAGLGPLPASLDEQIRNAFAALERMMHDQGGTLENVALLGLLLADAADLVAVLDAVAARWAPGARPALQLWSFPVPNRQQRVQLFASAVF